MHSTTTAADDDDDVDLAWSCMQSAHVSWGSTSKRGQTTTVSSQISHSVNDDDAGFLQILLSSERADW